MCFKDCEHLNKNSGRRSIKELRHIGDKPIFHQEKARVICESKKRLEDNPDLDIWISECPGNCPYFVEK